MDKRIFRITILLAICIVTYTMLTGDIAFADGLDVNASPDAQYGYKMDMSGLGTDFNKEFKKIFDAFITITNVLMIVMTATAGIMLGLGIEEGKRTLWNWLLGIGLAYNFTAVASSLGFFNIFNNLGTTTVTNAVDKLPQIKIATNDEAGTTGFLADFMKTYLDGIIKPGAKAIEPYCVKILLLLSAIEVGWEMSFKLISGDKVKYIMTMIIKMGFFIWLMDEWIYLTEALGNGFQQIGFIAGGSPNLQANSIGDNADKMISSAFQLFSAIWDKSSILDGIGLVFLTVIGLVVIIFAIFMTAIEMFMARLEFYTMAILTLPLLPFIVTSKFSFLADKAIGAMFNLAIKLSCISFVTAFCVPFFTSFVDKYVESKDPGGLSAIMQAILAALVIYYLVKKMPELVTGLLNGQPSLGGAGMMDTAKAAGGAAVGAAASVASGVGTVRAASAIAKGAGNGGKLGTLAQLGKAAIMSRSPVQKYRNAMQKMDSLVGAGRQSASNMRTNMRIGKSASGQTGTDESTMRHLEKHNERLDGDENNNKLSSRDTKQLEKLQKRFNDRWDSYKNDK